MVISDSNQPQKILDEAVSKPKSVFARDSSSSHADDASVSLAQDANSSATNLSSIDPKPGEFAGCSA